MKNFLSEIKNQKGAMHLLLLFSAIAVVVFLGLSSLAPFRDQLLSVINRKPDSFASLPSDTSYTAKVLVLKYFPVDSTGQNLDAAVTGSNKQLSLVREYVDKTTNEGIAQMTNGTKFHGYKDATAQPAINYQVINTKEYLEALPVSTFRPPNNNVTFRPDYQKVLTRENICDYVDNQGVSQIWVWGYHYGLIEPAESDMSMGTRSKQFWNFRDYGDVSNGEQSNNMPICNKTYVLYNYNFERGLGELLEDHGHQIEALYRFIDGNLWNNFQKPNGDTNPSVVNHCGWTHSPPNAGDWSGPRGQYQWNDKTFVKSNCEDWQPDGGGTVKDVNCNTWYEPYYKVSFANIACQDDTGVAFKVWWMQNIPGRGNTLTYQGKPLRNWWDLYADFDAAIASNRSLLADTSPNVKVSSTISANGWDKGNVVDGKYDSTPSSMGWTSDSNLNANHTEWIQIDLGSTKSVNEVKLYPRTDAPGGFFPLNFQIQTSHDGTNFTTVVDKVNYPNPGSQVQSFTFSPVQARHVKVNATNLMYAENSYRVQFAEIEVISSIAPSPSAASHSLTRRIESSLDDVNEINGKLDPNYPATYSQLWFGNAGPNESSWTGLRFRNVTIPKNAKIESAKVEVFSSKNQQINMDLMIYGNLVGDSDIFSHTIVPSNRLKTSKKVDIRTNDNWLANNWYSLGSITPIIQEIINLQSWKSGNGLTLVFQGIGQDFGRKFVTSFNGNPANAPKLTITYTVPSPSPVSTPTPMATPTPTPTATPTPTPVPTPQGRFVKITYPNGGETFKAGNNIDIKWSSNDVDFCILGYSSGPGSLDNIAVLNTNPETYNWTVNAGNIASPKQVKIDLLCYKRGVGSVSDQSDNFFTVNP